MARKTNGDMRKEYAKKRGKKKQLTVRKDAMNVWLTKLIDKLAEESPEDFGHLKPPPTILRRDARGQRNDTRGKRYPYRPGDKKHGFSDNRRSGVSETRGAVQSRKSVSRGPSM